MLMEKEKTMRLISEWFGESVKSLVIVNKDGKKWTSTAFSEGNLDDCFKKHPHNIYFLDEEFPNRLLVFRKTPSYPDDNYGLNDIVGVCRKSDTESMKEYMLDLLIQHRNEQDLKDKENRLEHLQNELDGVKDEIAAQKKAIASFEKERKSIEDGIRAKKTRMKNETRCLVNYHIRTGEFTVRKVVFHNAVRGWGEINVSPNEYNGAWCGECLEEKLDECKKTILDLYLKSRESDMRKANQEYYKAKDLLEGIGVKKG